MPMWISYISGMRRLVEGDNFKQLDEGTRDMGRVHLRSIPDGTRIIAFKTSIAEVEEIPQAVWDANIQKQKDAQDEQAAAAAKKESEDEQKEKDEKARQALAALEAKKLKNRLKRLLHIRQKPAAGKGSTA